MRIGRSVNDADVLLEPFHFLLEAMYRPETREIAPTDSTLSSSSSLKVAGMPESQAEEILGR